jgi:hypothetical protein
MANRRVLRVSWGGVREVVWRRVRTGSLMRSGGLDQERRERRIVLLGKGARRRRSWVRR